MKTSIFNISTEHPATGESILFNTLNGSITVWDNSHFQKVEQFLKNPNTEPVGKHEEKIKSNLIDNNYIIDGDVDEIEIVRHRKSLGIKDKNRLDVIIMPTLNCNFACPYCYELQQPSSMNDQTETAIKKWLEFEIPKYKFVWLNWFGGEPLLNYESILSITCFAKEMCAKFDVALLTNITTNGYLLDKDKIRELIALDVLRYQITVDGPPEIHNKTRILKGGGDSFSRIFENINLLIQADKRIKVSLRVNFNHNNICSIPVLLEMFPCDIRADLRVVYEPVFGKKCLSATNNLPHKQISRTLTEYYRLAQEMGYDIVLEGLKPNNLVYCYAERENQVVFNYNGDIHKCNVSDFKPEDRLGYLTPEGKIQYDEERLNKWFGVDLFEEKCYSCKFLPLCMGGCRKMRLEKDETGDNCCLFPGNISFELIAAAFQDFDTVLQTQYEQSEYNKGRR